MIINNKNDLVQEIFSLKLDGLKHIEIFEQLMNEGKIPENWSISAMQKFYQRNTKVERKNEIWLEKILNPIISGVKVTNRDKFCSYWFNLNNEEKINFMKWLSETAYWQMKLKPSEVTDYIVKQFEILEWLPETVVDVYLIDFFKENEDDIIKKRMIVSGLIEKLKYSTKSNREEILVKMCKIIQEQGIHTNDCCNKLVKILGKIGVLNENSIRHACPSEFKDSGMAKRKLGKTFQKLGRNTKEQKDNERFETIKSDETDKKKQAV